MTKSIPASRRLYDGRDVAFANYGEYWRQMKRISVLQLLSTTIVQSFQAIREEDTAQIVEKIRRSIPSVVNLTEIFAIVANNVLCRAAFGRKYDREGHNNFIVLFKKFRVSGWINSERSCAVAGSQQLWYLSKYFERESTNKKG